MRIGCFILWHYYGEEGTILKASSTVFGGEAHELSQVVFLRYDGKSRADDSAPYVIPAQVIHLPQTFQCCITWQDRVGKLSTSLLGIGGMRELQEHLKKHEEEFPHLIPMHIMQYPMKGWTRVPIS